jgi:hypothetical protein
MEYEPRFSTGVIAEKDWFVPIDVAVEGLTAEQASWKDGSGNHSVGQLTNHLLFWNRRELAKFMGEPEEKFRGNNDETFNNFDTKKRNDTVKQLDQVMVELENCVETADDEAADLGFGNRAHRDAQCVSRGTDDCCPQAARLVERREGL